MGDGDVSTAELGITPKDMGIAEQPTSEAISQAHSKIIRFDTPEYFAAYSEIKDKQPPMIFSFKTPDGNNTVELVGTQHAHQMQDQEKRDAMVAKINESLGSYLEKTSTDPKKRLLMIEGMSIPGTTTIEDRITKHTDAVNKIFLDQGINTEQQAVEKFGEMGTVMFGAVKEGLPIMSPEPSPEEMIAKLKEAGIAEIDIALKQALLNLDVNVHRGELKDEKKFTRLEVFKAFVDASLQSGWENDLTNDVKAKLTGNSESDGQLMKEYIDKILPQLNEQMNKNNVGFDLVRSDLSWSYDPTDRAVYNRLHSPTSDVDVFKKMSNITGEFRDDYILDRIVDSVSADKSPYMIYGDGHVIKLKPAVGSLYPQTQV